MSFNFEKIRTKNVVPFSNRLPRVIDEQQALFLSAVGSQWEAIEFVFDDMVDSTAQLHKNYDIIEKRYEFESKIFHYIWIVLDELSKLYMLIKSPHFRKFFLSDVEFFDMGQLKLVRKLRSKRTHFVENFGNLINKRNRPPLSGWIYIDLVDNGRSSQNEDGYMTEFERIILLGRGFRNEKTGGFVAPNDDSVCYYINVPNFHVNAFGEDLHVTQAVLRVKHFLDQFWEQIEKYFRVADLEKTRTPPISIRMTGQQLMRES